MNESSQIYKLLKIAWIVGLVVTGLLWIISMVAVLFRVYSFCILPNTLAAFLFICMFGIREIFFMILTWFSK